VRHENDFGTHEGGNSHILDKIVVETGENPEFDPTKLKDTILVPNY
jgi:hypothetical protein